MHNRKSMSRQKLYDLVWFTPISTLAKQFGLSDKGLAKKCIKHKIPTPPLGHWAKVNNGKKTQKVLLPKLKDTEKQLDTVVFNMSSWTDPLVEQVKVKFNIKGNEGKTKITSDKPSKLPVIRSYHPIIAKLRNNVGKAQSFDKYSRVTFSSCPNMGIKVSKQSFDRTCQLLEVLIRTCKPMDIDLVILTEQYDSSQKAVLKHDEITIAFEIREKLKRIENQPTDNKPWYDKYTYQPTGMLEFELMEYGRGLRTKWSDGKISTLDNQIQAIALGIQQVFELKQLRKIKAIADAEQNRVERNEQLEQERLELIDKQRQLHLDKLAKDYKRSQEVMNLVQAIEMKPIQAAGQEDWLVWAKEYATKLNPITNIESIIATFNKIPDLDSYNLQNLKW
ncbi:hypothetical protein [Methylophaga sp.]|uniref:hypothetical protein n=1 Tax=Methylophaga sp. TaxID=2024840 RepID=UPI003A8E73BF